MCDFGKFLLPKYLDIIMAPKLFLSVQNGTLKMACHFVAKIPCHNFGTKNFSKSLKWHLRKWHSIFWQADESTLRPPKNSALLHMRPPFPSPNPILPPVSWNLQVGAEVGARCWDQRCRYLKVSKWTGGRPTGPWRFKDFKEFSHDLSFPKSLTSPLAPLGPATHVDQPCGR